LLLHYLTLPCLRDGDEKCGGGIVPNDRYLDTKPGTAAGEDEEDEDPGIGVCTAPSIAKGGVLATAWPRQV
jgi:hypothetical protein